MHRATTSGQVTAEIRAEMARQGISQSRLATTSGVVRSSLTRKLRDQQPFTLPEALAVADALGIPLSEFFRRAEQGVAA